MDKAQTEPQKLGGDAAADVAPKIEDQKPAVEKTTKTDEATGDGADAAKKKDDEIAAAATATPQKTSTDEKNVKQEAEKEAKSDDAPATKNNTTPAEAKPAAETQPAGTASTGGEPSKPAYITGNPALSQLFDQLASITHRAEHDEMWGVTLTDYNDIPTVNVLIKFLRANEGNVDLAAKQLFQALDWRMKMKPWSLCKETRHDKTNFDGLGYITTYNDGKDVFTWNIYGAVKDINKTFGDLDAYVHDVSTILLHRLTPFRFIDWRVALMELAIKELKLNEATEVIDYEGEDPYKMFQVHDYQNVSFLRMNPTIRAASRTIIEVFSMAYPELLKEKFFVNVPAIMGWMFAAMKVFLSKNTTRKFHPIANGANLAREFSDFGDAIPENYGGKGDKLQGKAQTVLFTEDEAEAEATATS
ncbi:Non-classical phosphatidylinositol transfer protein (PITP) [Arachnomyces sp. PD_36]|nr:Non-classical phosphatidylinositol transfer protein (PITP) [Arachnomyces sp. PD_36]